MEDTSLEVHLEDLIETLAVAQSKSPAYFVGHSLGAMISMVLALHEPQWVESVFAASLPGKVLPQVVHSFNFFMKGPKQALQASGISRHLAWRERTLLEMPEFTLKEISRQFGKVDLRDEFVKVKCPVHLAVGRFDPVAVCWQVRRMHERLSNSTLTVFEWSGHNFMDAIPDKFNEWIVSRINDDGTEKNLSTSKSTSA
jgi:pimeloyl-ACP methyl ester carboxylesterase